ncbi:FAD/NAD(P)-binding domain-containing protein [Rhizodiscina lignyota]|uniref:FAD/NAD(P)-binding domain-containing protein n=1 Tax=Rhizodiscina lignyota TaxID=1504668 RepID=A0A9P4IAS3_9PEZI|nr:FAD/NAD(P)-binding domain-containing protein [Rhizodiscina lignyota]
MQASINAKRVAIVGAGPSGIAAAKYCFAEKAFESIVVFEQRSSAGGLWNATPQEWDEAAFTIPSTNAAVKVDEPLWRPKVGASSSSGSEASSATTSGSSSPRTVGGKDPVFISPIYDRLETNIPRSLMRFSDHFFGDDVQLFPPHQAVQEYIVQYARDVRHLIRFETQVVDIRLQDDPVSSPDKHGKDSWNMEVRDLQTNTYTTEVFDAVILANGHFSTPYVPEVPGIREWQTAFPGSITHAKYYRRPEEYADKRVLVVGNFASGTDIASQIIPYCKNPVLISAKSTNELPAPPSSSKRELPTIASFNVAGGSVTFANGHTEHNIDSIIFCTGYLYTFPFLKSLRPPLITSGYYVENSYLHLFYAPHPTLSFLAIPQKIIPFPLAEAQAAAVARIYSGRLSLPSYAEMKQWEQDLLSSLPEGGSKSAFHKLPFPKDANYINMMYDWAAGALQKAGLENDGLGKMPRRWGEWEFWCRGRFPAIKKAFSEKGEKRRDVTRLEELGFDFEKWKMEEETVRH